jgi:AcrR family transcriptional regulator
MAKRTSKVATRRGEAAGQAAPGRPQKSGTRAAKAAERRTAILNAALDEFAARGFAATRLDDVAQRAGVAKGTIYLYFADKETLFQELIRQELSPVVGTIEHLSHNQVPLKMLAPALAEVFAREIFGTRRKDVIRLVLSEGPRFPKLAEFYFHEVIAHVMEAIRAMLRSAKERGELKHDALIRFPQLLAAPGLVALLWSGLFERFEPLDIRELLRAHFEILFGETP